LLPPFDGPACIRFQTIIHTLFLERKSPVLIIGKSLKSLKLQNGGDERGARLGCRCRRRIRRRGTEGANFE
jgi:hypothetical protein